MYSAVWPVKSSKNMFGFVKKTPYHICSHKWESLGRDSCSFPSRIITGNVTHHLPGIFCGILRARKDGACFGQRPLPPLMLRSRGIGVGVLGVELAEF